MPDQDQTKPILKSGLARIIAATGYSLAGLQRLKIEPAFRHEILALPILLLAYAIFGATGGEYIAFAILFLLLIAFESLNTAIETLVDHLTADWAQFAKEAKDLGSLSVMCILAGHALLILYVIFT